MSNIVVAHVFFIFYHDVRIDPGSAFRLAVKVSAYIADGDFGLVHIDQQHHDIWFDRNNQYSLVDLHKDLAAKIIWGPSQTVAVWVLDQQSGSEWKLRRDEHVHQMIKDRWDDRLAFVAVEVVRKDGDHDGSTSSRARCVSGVTSGNEPNAEANDLEGFGDICSSPSPPTEQLVAVVDWTTLIVQENPDDDGTAVQLVNEDQVYDAMGFKVSDPTPEGVPIPAMTRQMQQDMNEAAVNVDDTADEEPLYEWDRDNPDMSVGICYPNIEELRLALRQHAIVKHFEFDIEHSDQDRYRVCCASLGCPWKLRAKVQHDGSCRVYFFCIYFSFTLILC
jgi:hypothetical protein